MEGRKNDNKKLRYDLLPAGPIEEVVKILTFGAGKYDDENWKKVPNAKERYYAAAMRHLAAWKQGEKNDQETGLNHLSHAICCLLFMLHFDITTKKTVYVAGPYTADPVANTQEAIRIANLIIDLGYNVFVPHLFHYLDIQQPRPYMEWIDMDMDWQDKCDILFRFPGKSPGADSEVRHAEEIGQPVFIDLEKLKNYSKE